MRSIVSINRSRESNLKKKVSHDHELHQDVPEAPQPWQGHRQHQEESARALARPLALALVLQDGRVDWPMFRWG